MQLTRHTDYALRLLIYLAVHDAENPGERASIAQVAESQAISRTHLMKIANELAHAGFIDAARGRGGGIRLARPANQISIDAVVKAMEPACALVDCSGCRMVRRCSLPGAFQQARAAFDKVLAGYTLADVIRQTTRAPGEPGCGAV